VWIDEVIQTSPGIDTSGYQIQVNNSSSVFESINSIIVRLGHNPLP